MNPFAPPFQQVDRTYVLYRGRKLSYFGGCDYFRLASHPQVLRALCRGLDKYGLNVAASRRTTGNHALYEELEEALARFFDIEAAVVVSSGYAANLAVAQALAGRFTHALVDERAHASLADAARFLGAPVRKFAHRDVASAASALRRCGPKAHPLLLTDGLFSHDGSVAPLSDYLRLLATRGVLLVDDAHGAGVLGKNGRGTAEHLGVSNPRLIQTITLSKAFGVYGGAVLGLRWVRDAVVGDSRLFAGNTPLPLPLVSAALTALKLVRADLRFRERLERNTRHVKSTLRERGFPVGDGPGPIISRQARTAAESDAVRRRLLAAGVYPSLVKYPGGPARGYFRFALSSEHTRTQLDALVEALSTGLANTLRRSRHLGCAQPMNRRMTK
jgi:7-keto-8-aminopelargonate synthetase-like enzyme